MVFFAVVFFEPEVLAVDLVRPVLCLERPDLFLAVLFLAVLFLAVLFLAVLFLAVLFLEEVGAASERVRSSSRARRRSIRSRSALVARPRASTWSCIS